MKAFVYHWTPPGGPGLQDFRLNSAGEQVRRVAEAGLVHLFQRRRPDGGLDYLYVPASRRTHRFIKEITR
jgi:predicted transcriptional regulator